MLIDALNKKPVDWKQVESIIRSYQSVESAVEEYAALHFRDPHHAYYIDTDHKVDRGSHLRRALVHAVVRGLPAESVRQAAGLYRAESGQTPKAILAAFFEDREAHKTHNFKRRAPEEIAKLTPEDVKPKLPAAPLSGSWWRTADGGFAINLQFDAKATDEQITHWFTKHMDEA